MNLDITRFFNHQTDFSTQSDVMELSSTELEIVSGGRYCPRSNGFPYGENPYLSAGYNYGDFPGSGYGYANGFGQPSPCQVPPSPCSYYSY